MRKQALITGGAGFIGRHMALELEERGYDVLTVDVEPMAVDIKPGKTSRVHIVQDANKFFMNEVSRHHPSQFDLIVHCAFHVGGRAAIDGVNMNLTKNLQLDAAMFDWATRTQRGNQVLYWSSSAVYPVALQTGFDPDRLQELDQWIGFDDATRQIAPDAGYGWAKYVGELQAQKAQLNGLIVSVVRPFSGYGEDQSMDYPFPAFVERIQKCALQDQFVVWGNPASTRDWIHVDDVVNGALAVVESLYNHPVNLCTGQATTMSDLALMMANMLDKEIEVVGDYTKPTGVMHRVGDPSVMQRYYQPVVSLEEGIGRALRRF